MRKEDRGVIGDWLVVASAMLLFISLFLIWSRISPSYAALADRLRTLQGVPQAPNAWQVYSAADVTLAVLAAGLLFVALVGTKTAQICALAAVFVALAFAIHAASSPPTNGAPTAFLPGLDIPARVTPSPRPGPGETAAIIALVVAVGGLAVSMTAD